MNQNPARRLQRLVDPELCAVCLACYESCPKGAIHVRGRRLAIDPEACGDCRACVAACSTGAIEVVRPFPAEGPYSLEEQFAWDKLPPDEF